MPRRIDWWPEAEAMLRAGKTYAEVGKRVGRTPGTVYRAARRHGIVRRARVADWWPKAEELLRAGMTYAEVGERIGKTRQSVQQAAKQRGITARSRRTQA